VALYHKETVKSMVELIVAAGLSHTSQIKRSLVYRRVFMNEVKTYEELFPTISKGCLLEDNISENYKKLFQFANHERF